MSSNDQKFIENLFYMEANKKRLYQDVDFLSSIRPFRNYKNIESLRKAAKYIEHEFKKINLTTSRQQWEAKGNMYENIIASHQPEKKRRLIIGAHYDVYKNQPGADDNTSGVAGLLETARLLVKTNPEIDYGIDFVSYCLEEPPFFRSEEMGSFIHAKSVHEHNQDIIGMISFEMIGYFAGNPDEPPSSNPPSVIVSGIRKYEDFNKKVSELLKANSNLGAKRVTFANGYANNGPSDHRNYWTFNYPAVMIIAASKNPHYHQESDTIDTLDFGHLAEVVNSSIHAVSHLGK